MAKIGRPTSYNPDYCEDIVNYFTIPPKNIMYERTYYKDGSLKSEIPIIMGAEFPTFQGYAQKIGVDMSTLTKWRTEIPEFSTAYARAKDLQEKIWLINSMGGQYNAQFSKFFGINCLGYKEKIETENTNTNKVVIDFGELDTD